MKDNVSINLNKRNVTEFTAGTRSIRSRLRPGIGGCSRFAVLELSTKAVKLLIGNDDEAIKENLSALAEGRQGVRFSFSNFFRTTDKVEAGKGLDSQNVMNMDYFSRRVMWSILDKKNIMLDKGIDTVYTIATAAYRTAANRDEVLDFIRERARINVRILTKEEEANATLFAYFFTTVYRVQLQQAKNVIMIDQGGGSTEVSVFKGCNGGEGKPYSINLGTTALRNFLFKDSRTDTPLEQAFKNSDRKIAERLRTFYVNMDECMSASGEVFCIAVGTAITSAAGRGGNAKQHDKMLTKEDVCKRIKKAEEIVLARVKTVGELDAELERLGPNDPYDREVTVRLGLPMYMVLMEKYQMSEIHISGAGLWYGIYLQRLMGMLKED